MLPEDTSFTGLRLGSPRVRVIVDSPRLTL